MIDYTGWSREYLENKEEYLKLFDNVMQKENERNVEFLEKNITSIIKTSLTREVFIIENRNGGPNIYSGPH